MGEKINLSTQASLGNLPQDASCLTKSILFHSLDPRSVKQAIEERVRMGPWALMFKHEVSWWNCLGMALLEVCHWGWF